MTFGNGLRVAAALAAASGGGMAAGYVVAAQPHMGQALRDLRSAEGELRAAATNKAGHRERAIDLVRQAIGEVEAGIAAGG